MKKLLNVFLVLCLGVGLSVGVINAAQAATTDFFQITVTVGYISISLVDYAGANYTTWAIGALSTSGVATMAANGGSAGELGIMVSNESNVNIDLSSFATNSLGWTLVTGTPSANEYRLRAKAFAAWEAGPLPNLSTGATAIAATSSPGTSFVTGIGSGAERYTYYQFTAPSSVSTGGSNTITVTVEATGS
jgi:hypothetical protein